MTYEIRKLSGEDIFPVAKILSKLGIKNLKEAFTDADIQSLIASEDKQAVGVAIGFNVAGIILENLPACENEIYKFLSDVTGERIEKLRKDPLADFAELIISIVQKEEFKDFFRVVSKLLN